MFLVFCLFCHIFVARISHQTMIITWGQLENFGENCMQSWTTEGEDEDEEDTCISFCDQYSTCVLAHFDRPTSTCNTCLAPVIAQKLDNSQSKKIALKIDSVQSCAENPYRNYSITLSNKNYGIIYDDKAGIWNITEKECVTMECVANKLKSNGYK